MHITKFGRLLKNFKVILVGIVGIAGICVFSRVQLSVTPWTVARQLPLSIEFSRHEHWSGLPFPIPGDLPDPGIKPMSFVSPALAGRFFTKCATWEAQNIKNRN